MSRRRRKGSIATVCRVGIAHGNEQWTPIPYKMWFSPAMQALTAKERDLYIVARKQEINARLHEEKRASGKGELNGDFYPLDRWPNLDAMTGTLIPFYLNEALLVRHKGRKDPGGDWFAQMIGVQRLYADSKNLKASRKKLVAYGLLKEIPVGAGSIRNVKGVYVLSDRWRGITNEDIERIKAQMKTG